KYRIYEGKQPTTHEASIKNIATGRKAMTLQPPVSRGVTIPGGALASRAFAAITRATDNLVRRYLPDPLVLAIIFTAIVFVAGVALTDSGPGDMIVYWGDGFWNLLTLAMQFVLVLCTGFILAISPVSKR